MTFREWWDMHKQQICGGMPSQMQGYFKSVAQLAWEASLVNTGGRP